MNINYFLNLNILVILVNQFAKNFSFINQTLENNETKITYIAYNSFKYNSLINIYDYHICRDTTKV